MHKPTLAVVSGPPGGAGKTTLAHTLAKGLGCPAICRDEIKEGIVHATPGYSPNPGDDITQRTLRAFFDVLTVLTQAGVSIVAEAAFQDHLWQPGLQPLLSLTQMRIIHCTVDPAAARTRGLQRDLTNPRRSAHLRLDQIHQRYSPHRQTEPFVPVSLPVPTMQVDTTLGYQPSLESILDFIEHGKL